MRTSSLFLSLYLLVSQVAFARPEYATGQKLNCTSCHVSPWGGGPRIVFGKVFGSHGHDPAKTSSNDLYYGDLRIIDYLPTKSPEKKTNGLALMEAAATANVPIFEHENRSEMRGVFTYNISPLAGSNLREAYIRFQLPSRPDAVPAHVLIGHFYVPFGLLTDEHRTYTRLQTNMTFNNYDVGVALSWNPHQDWHLDLALVNDFQSGGGFISNDLTFGAVVNARWNPHELPFLLGISGNYQKTLNYPQPLASSLYGVLSLDRATHDHVSGSLSLERVDARNWNNPTLNNGGINPGLAGFFIPPSEQAFLSSVATAHSVGYYALLKLNATHVWTPFYKLDYLDLDLTKDHDTFLRHGFGIEAYLNSNLILNVRYELAHVNQPQTASSNVLAAQSDVYAMLRMWL